MPRKHTSVSLSVPPQTNLKSANAKETKFVFTPHFFFCISSEMAKVVDEIASARQRIQQMQGDAKALLNFVDKIKKYIHPNHQSVAILQGARHARNVTGVTVKKIKKPKQRKTQFQSRDDSPDPRDPNETFGGGFKSAAKPKKQSAKKSAAKKPKKQKTAAEQKKINERMAKLRAAKDAKQNGGGRFSVKSAPKAASSQRAPSQRAPSQRAPSQRAPSQRAPSQRAPSQRAPSQRAQSTRGRSQTQAARVARSPDEEYDLDDKEEVYAPEEFEYDERDEGDYYSPAREEYDVEEYDGPLPEEPDYSELMQPDYAPSPARQDPGWSNPKTSNYVAPGRQMDAAGIDWDEWDEYEPVV